jgi:threonine dehydrogenase-like Zn-dependent dehydrogenase
MGVEDVTIVNRSRGRLEIAKVLDKQVPFETVSTLDENWLEILEEHFGTTRTQTGPALDVDIWIDAASNAELLQTVYNKSKLFARISVVGVHHKPVEFDLRKLTWSGVELLGSAGYRPDDVPRVMKAMESGRYDIDSIVTATYPFDKFDEAIESCQDGSKCLKCQVDFSDSQYANWREEL